jgi:hypothetical protein
MQAKAASPNGRAQDRERDSKEPSLPDKIANECPEVLNGFEERGDDFGHIPQLGHSKCVYELNALLYAEMSAGVT